MSLLEILPPQCNILTVLGGGDLSCVLRNEASISDPTSMDYLGREVAWSEAAPHLRTQRAVDAHCRALYEKLCRAVDLREDAE